MDMNSQPFEVFSQSCRSRRPLDPLMVKPVNKHDQLKNKNSEDFHLFPF